MSFCSFADGAAMFDATPIENLFLMEYMYDTPEQALKVYLYARMLALHPELGGSPADVAKALRMTEDEVHQAFRFLERRDLVRGVGDNPPRYQLLPLRAQASAGMSALDQEIYANRDFNNRLQALFGTALIGQHELTKASDWVNLLHLEKDAVVRLVAYGQVTSRVKNPKPASVFKRMDAVAEAWSQKGVRTLQDVERAIAEEKLTGIAKDVLKKLGLNRPPTDPELQLMQRWIDDWGFDREQILDACQDTLSARNPTVKYLNAILENRRQEAPGDFEALSEVLRELNPQSAQPSPDQLQRYRALLAEGFPPEVIKLAAVQCHRKNKHTFDDLAWRLNLWRREGVGDTLEAAENYTRAMSALAWQLREVLQAAGSDRSPSYGEIEIYRRWKDAYPEELIKFAAECARNAKGSMAYMDKLLTQWAQAGVTTTEAARAQHAAWRASAAPEPSKPANPALDYAQREYKEEDFGDDFYFDYDKVFGDGGKKP